MNKVQKIREKVVWLMSNHDSALDYEAALEDVLNIIDSMQEEPVSEVLELAATKYAQDKYMPVQTSQAFKAGAKWQKQQMIKDAIDAHCFGLQGDALFSFRLPASKYLVGSEVKVIVIKED